MLTNYACVLSISTMTLTILLVSGPLWPWTWMLLYLLYWLVTLTFILGLGHPVAGCPLCGFTHLRNGLLARPSLSLPCLGTLLSVGWMMSAQVLLISPGTTWLLTKF